MNQFRNLRADEIDVRVATCSEKGCSLLLYKDARVDQNILDETFGIYGWERTHQLIGDRLYCTVRVKNPETGEWISKQDVGTESNTEKEKGQASDSFKRACFNLGIGRELYTAPFIWITPDKFKLAKNSAGKPTTYDRFKVKKIGYEGGAITSLVITNNGKSVFSLLGNSAPEPEKPVNMGEKISPKQALTIKMMAKRHEMPEEHIYKRFKRNSIDDMTIADWVTFGQTGQEILDKWDKEHGKQ